MPQKSKSATRLTVKSIKMKTKILLTTLHLLILLLTFQQGKTQELYEYLKEAGENHPGIRAAYQEYYAALEQVDQSGTLPDPKLSLGYFLSPVETRLGPQKLKISISQMFPWFGTLKQKEKAAAEQAQVKYQAFLEKRNTVYKKVRIEWYNLYKTSKAIKITRENIEVLQSLKTLTRRNYENNKGRMAELLKIDVNIREQKNTLKELRERLSAQKTDFNLLLNRSPGDSLKAPRQIRDNTFDIAAFRDSTRNHPEIIALENKEKAIKHQLEVNRKKGYPDISLGLDYAVIDERQDMQVNNSGRDVIMPMVGISIPLYRKKYRAMEKQTQFRLEAVRSRQQEKNNQLSSSYRQAEKAYLDARRNVDLYNEQVEQTQKIFRLLKTSYASDGESFFELLRTRLMLLEYELKLEKARAGKNIAVARLEYLTNRPAPYKTEQIQSKR